MCKLGQIDGQEIGVDNPNTLVTGKSACQSFGERTVKLDHCKRGSSGRSDAIAEDAKTGPDFDYRAVRTKLGRGNDAIRYRGLHQKILTTAARRPHARSAEVMSG
jgi:hypothetical protein